MRIERVETADDPRLADYAGLTDVALRRVLEPAGGLYIAESTRVIERALRAGHRPRSVLLQEQWLDELAPLLAEFDGPCFVGERGVLEAVTGFVMHRGALAAMHRPELPTVEAVVTGAHRIAVIEDVVDHTNLGALFRSAAALGVDAVLVTPRCADPLYRRSVRVSMGTVFQVPWTRIRDWPHPAAGADRLGGIPLLHSLGFEVVALALSDDSISLDELAASAPERLALVLGTEGDGLSARTVAACDRTVRIPMAGGVDSLNVAAAAAVAFWATRAP